MRAARPACDCLVRLAQNCVDSDACRPFLYHQLLPSILHHCIKNTMPAAGQSSAAAAVATAPLSDLNNMDSAPSGSAESAMQIDDTRQQPAANNTGCQFVAGGGDASPDADSVCDHCSQCRAVSHASLFCSEEILSVLLRFIRCVVCRASDR